MMRKRSWYPLMSLLLVAVLVPVQAAGCCRLASILGVLQNTDIRPAGDRPEAEADVGSGAPAGNGTSAGSGSSETAGSPAFATADGQSHACCRRKAAAGSAGSSVDMILEASMEAQAAEDPAYTSEPAAATAESGKAGGHCGAGSRDDSKGCCLEGAPHADPGLVSTESLAAFPVPTRLQVSDEPLPSAPSLPDLALPSDSGPPVYLAFRRLLI